MSSIFIMSSWIKLYICFLMVVDFEGVVCNQHTRIKRNRTYSVYIIHINNRNDACVHDSVYLSVRILSFKMCMHL